MRSIPAAIALMMLAWIISSTAALFSTGSSPPNVAQGELRCEGAGAIVINIDGGGLRGQWNGKSPLSFDTARVESHHLSRK